MSEGGKDRKGAKATRVQSAWAEQAYKGKRRQRHEVGYRLAGRGSGQRRRDAGEKTLWELTRGLQEDA